jgi:hypothetical protein
MLMPLSKRYSNRCNQLQELLPSASVNIKKKVVRGIIQHISMKCPNEEMKRGMHRFLHGMEGRNNPYYQPASKEVMTSSISSH